MDCKPTYIYVTGKFHWKNEHAQNYTTKEKDPLLSHWIIIKETSDKEYVDLKQNI